MLEVVLCFCGFFGFVLWMLVVMCGVCMLFWIGWLIMCGCWELFFLSVMKLFEWEEIVGLDVLCCVVFLVMFLFY